MLQEYRDALALSWNGPLPGESGVFPDFHDGFITYLRENLQLSLPPPYYAALGRRVWIAASRRSIGPDVHVLRREAEPRVPTRSPSLLAVAGRRVSRRVAIKVLSDEYREPFVEICASVDGDKRLVTSIEVLSLSNKTSGEHGREPDSCAAKGVACKQDQSGGNRPPARW